MTTATETKKPAPARRKRGRPKGSKNKKPAAEQSVTLSRCPSCGSTDREKYRQPREMEFSGIAPDGRPYTHVVWRRTSCKACGQYRVDKTYENRK